MSTTTQIDLKPFCSDQPKSHYSFPEPFVFRGWRYATDGRIAVRVPAPGEQDSEKRIDSVADVFGPPDFTPESWPANPCVRGDGECPTCEGEGYVGRVECEECDGFGEYECSHCGQDTDCEECDGKGYVTKGSICPECCGKKRVEQDLYQVVGTLHVAAKYAALIQALPGVRWAGNVPMSSSGRVMFLFDGGEGVVMSLNVK